MENERRSRDHTGGHFGLIWCTDHDWSRYQRALIDTFSGETDRWTIIDAPGGDLHHDWSELDGFLIGGSEHSINDDSLPWRDALGALLNECLITKTPVVGICFGAQALGYALGGKVAPNPSNEFTFLVEPINLEPPLSNWFRELSYPLPRLIESHGDCIQQLPPDAVHLASSASAQHEIFRLGSTMIGVQGHPEISIDLALEEVLDLHKNSGVLDSQQASRSETALRQSRPEIQGIVALCRTFLTGVGESRPLTGMKPSGQGQAL